MSKIEKKSNENLSQIAQSFISSIFTELNPVKIDEIKSSMAQFNNNTAKAHQRVKSCATKRKFSSRSPLNLTCSATKNEHKNKKPKILRKNLTAEIEVKIKEPIKNYKDSLKEKKMTQMKIDGIKRRINLLKNQQLDMNKKVQNIKNKEKFLDDIKRNNEQIKQFLLSAEIDKRKELENKRKNISICKEMHEYYMRESKEKIFDQKLKNYKMSMEEKMRNKMFINNYKLSLKHNNQENVNKIKQTRTIAKENNIKKLMKNESNLETAYKTKTQINVSENLKLKEELLQLEAIENEYLKNLADTKNILSISHSAFDKNKRNNLKLSKKLFYSNTHSGKKFMTNTAKYSNQKNFLDDIKEN